MTDSVQMLANTRATLLVLEEAQQAGLPLPQHTSVYDHRGRLMMQLASHAEVREWADAHDPDAPYLHENIEHLNANLTVYGVEVTLYAAPNADERQAKAKARGRA